MVRNIDLPKALVFYGLESIMIQEIDEGSVESEANDSITCTLRSGVTRLLKECQEVGTAALLLSEDQDIVDEDYLRNTFQEALKRSPDIGGDDALENLNFRCLNSELSVPMNDIDDGTSENNSPDEYDENIELYNLQTNGRSPCPAFLLDSLRSVHIDPRGFGGSSGFGRGQWIEPRRSPMPARTVVFIAGDWSKNKFEIMDDYERSTVSDRCAAARATGCRVIYLEQILDQTKHEVPVQDDSQTMALCDAVVPSLGNDNPRDLQPISLDAISTPGDYWLNPPSPRDDVGNAVTVDEIVEWFRSEREMEEIAGDAGCVVSDNGNDESEMNEDEMNKILADLDSL